NNENSVDPLNQSDDVLQAAVENEEKGHVERRQGDEQRRCLVPRRRPAEAQRSQERSSGETAKADQAEDRVDNAVPAGRVDGRKFVSGEKAYAGGAYGVNPKKQHAGARSVLAGKSEGQRPDQRHGTQRQG